MTSNPNLLKEYAKMSRSKEGLKAAGEWHQLKPLFPSLEGKSVLAEATLFPD